VNGVDEDVRRGLRHRPPPWVSPLSVG
jgi:hypothetical protein